MTAQHPGTAIPLAHSVAPIGHDYINTKGIVYMEDVHNFALQIACGLQHLASMEVLYDTNMYMYCTDDYIGRNSTVCSCILFGTT